MLETVRDSRPAGPEQRAGNVFQPRSGFSHCSSHGGSPAVTDAAQNPTLNALQVKFQQEPRLFRQGKSFHVTDLTRWKCAVSAQQHSGQHSRNCPGRGAVDGNFGSRRRLLVPAVVTNCVRVLSEDRASPQTKRFCLF